MAAVILKYSCFAAPERKIAESEEDRARFWNYDPSSPEAYARSIAPNRERFRHIIGLADERAAPDLERYGTDANPALVYEEGKGVCVVDTRIILKKS